jgi:predicted dehydrogenase
MKVLLAGLGSSGQRHARNLRTLLGDEVELLAYRVRGLRHVVTPEAGIVRGADGVTLDVEETLRVRSFGSLEAALAERPDAVFVTNPNSLHMPVALAAARAGCHLFIEKPLSHTLEGVRELTDLVERNDLVCLVGYHLRFHPALQKAKEWLSLGKIGRVVAARLAFGEHLSDWHPYEDYRQMHASRRDQGGGVILSQSHDLDYALALFGFPRRVFAMGGTLSGFDVDVEDTASILMECASGDRLFPVHLHQDFVQRPKRRTCEVIGDAGSIRLDLNAGSVERTDGRGQLVETDVFEVPRNDLFLDELRHFLACLSGDEWPAVGVREGTKSLLMALAAKASLETGAPVSLK